MDQREPRDGHEGEALAALRCLHLGAAADDRPPGGRLEVVAGAADDLPLRLLAAAAAAGRAERQNRAEREPFARMGAGYEAA